LHPDPAPQAGRRHHHGMQETAAMADGS